MVNEKYGYEDELDEEPAEDPNEYVLLNSVDVAFKPSAWGVPEVKVIYSSAGKPLAFAAISNFNCSNKVRTALPVELFNHQLLEVDYRDPEELAKFMSEYGFIYSTVDRPIGGDATKRLVEDLAALDPCDQEAITQFEQNYGYMPSAGFSNSLWNWDEASAHYIELKEAVIGADAKLQQAQEGTNFLNKVRIRGLISIERAQYNFEEWLYCAKYIKAMACFKTRKELACALGESEISIMRRAANAINIIQRHLNGIHPSLDILDATTDEPYTTHFRQSPGNFQQALALQLWQFTLEAKTGYTICKECGQAFVHKQTKAKRSQSRSSSVFCCDKCKNRFAQREYRKSPGYKMKVKQGKK